MGWLVVVFLLWSAPVFAETTVPLQGKTIDAGLLTQEAKDRVGTLEGIAQEGNTVVFRRVSGEFTAAEKAALQAVVASHDATVRVTEEQTRRTTRQQAKDKLQALGLTAKEVEALFP